MTGADTHPRADSRNRARTRELEVIDRFVSLVVDSSRSPRQRQRLGRAAGATLTDSGGSLLRVLARHGPLTLSRLAHRVGLDQSTVSRQVASLESRELVEREVDPVDRRRHRVAISPVGIELLANIRAVALHDYDSALAAWSDDERELFASMLDRFHRALVDADVDAQGWSVAAPVDR